MAKSQGKVYTIKGIDEIVRGLIDIYRAPGDLPEKKKITAELLMKNFNAKGCILCMLDEDKITESLLFGQIPHLGKSPEEAEKNAAKEHIIKEARIFFNRGKRVAGDKSSIHSIKLKEKGKDAVGTITTIIRYKGKPLAMIILLKPLRPCGNNEPIFRRINPHIQSILIKQ